MNKSTIIRRIALLVCVIMLLTSTVQTTYCFIVTKTDPIVNTFVPFRGLVNDLLIRKTVEHPYGDSYVIPEDIAFDFQVELGAYYAGSTITTTAGETTADENGVINIRVKPGTDVGIQGIDDGTRVTVTEIQREGNGFTVKNGAVTQEAIISEYGSVTVEFTNIYAPEAVQPETVTVTGVKILEGRNWQQGDTFSFLLEQNTGENSWTALGTETVTYDPEDPDFDQFDFTDILQSLQFDHIGTYKFRMTEIPGQLENMSYDETVKYFTIVVTDEDMDGKLELHSVTGSEHVQVTGKYDVAVTFNNTFLAPPVPDDISLRITAQKTVVNKGKATIGPENFEFVLKDTTAGENLTARSDKKGLANFDLNFTASDIGKSFHFELTETNDGRKGVIYSEAVYDITVTITLSPDNELVATVTCNGEETARCVAPFENIYCVEPESPPTNDENYLNLWFILMVLSSICCILLLSMDNRKSTSRRGS